MTEGDWVALWAILLALMLVVATIYTVLTELVL